MTDKSIQERLLKTAIKMNVFKKLENIEKEFGEFIRDMTEEMSIKEDKEAKLIVLEIVREASVEFYTKLKYRIEHGPS